MLCPETPGQVLTIPLVNHSNDLLIIIQVDDNDGIDCLFLGSINTHHKRNPGKVGPGCAPFFSV